MDCTQRALCHIGVCSHSPSDRSDGQKEALHTLQTLPMGPLPTDTHAAFKWWLFVANLGDKKDRVIGTGIIDAVLEDQWEDGVVLLFKRQDGTEVRLEIQQPVRGPCSTRIL